jgi:hypothetical protein
MMARRIKNWNTPAGRYPWTEWTDGSIWEITFGEDYDVPTENMRVNLHERARLQQQQVKTAIFREGDKEGLRFQFIGPALLRLRPLSQNWRYPINDPRRFQTPTSPRPRNTRVRISAGQHGDLVRVIDVAPEEFKREYDAHDDRGEMWLRDRRSDAPNRKTALNWRIHKPTIISWEPTSDPSDPIPAT